jgi:hypothetical protein
MGKTEVRIKESKKRNEMLTEHEGGMEGAE